MDISIIIITMFNYNFNDNMKKYFDEITKEKKSIDIQV